MRQSLATTLSLLAALVGAGSGCARRDLMALPQPLWSKLNEPPTDTAIFAQEEESLRVDQLQLMGSHNSYHRAPPFALSRRFRYSHASIEQQLESQGVRHLELDVRYTNGAVRVGHAPIIDGESSCVYFDGCIRAIKRWSKAHPLHVPIFVFVQPKDGLIGAALDGKLELIDREIGRVFSLHDLLLPRDVARGFPSLRSAVREIGWPTLESTRGKVAFVLFGHGRLVKQYARGRNRLEGRLMFAAASHAGAPYAAILSVDDPIARQTDIVHAVQDRLLVRTRADANLVRDRRRRDAAIDSGAHFIGSDFVDPSHAWLDLGPDTPARKNPLTGSVSHLRTRVLETERTLTARLSTR